MWIEEHPGILSFMLRMHVPQAAYVCICIAKARTCNFAAASGNIVGFLISLVKF